MIRQGCLQGVLRNPLEIQIAGGRRNHPRRPDLDSIYKEISRNSRIASLSLECMENDFGSLQRRQRDAPGNRGADADAYGPGVCRTDTPALVSLVPSLTG